MLKTQLDNNFFIWNLLVVDFHFKNVPFITAAAATYCQTEAKGVYFQGMFFKTEKKLSNHWTGFNFVV